MYINLKLAIVLIVFFFIFYPLIIIFCFRKNLKVLQIIAKLSFIFYLVLVSILVFGDVGVKNNLFFVRLIADVPWFTLDFCIASFSKSNILYNLIMMIPISAFVYANSNILEINSKDFVKNQKIIILKTILVSFAISLFIEVFQFILPVSRTTELFDLVTNTFSGVLGYVFFFFLILIYKIIKEKKQPKEQL